jgi:RHS repeat-associated protein
MNQLISKTEAGVEYGFTYDRRGNLIQEEDITGGNIVKTYQYDATSRMTLGIKASGETSAYTYNGLKALVSHTATTQAGVEVITDYVIDYTSPVQLQLAAYGSNGIETSYVYGNGLEKISAKVNSQRYSIQTDRLGSGKIATDENGQVVAHTVFDEWGNITEKTMLTVGDVTVDIIGNFTNHEYDAVMGIYYAKARFYDPAAMRFTANDPAKDGWNWYAYAGNNPVMNFDPDGLLSLPNGSGMDFITGAGDGFTEYFVDSYDAISNLPNDLKEIISNPGEYLPEILAGIWDELMSMGFVFFYRDIITAFHNAYKQCGMYGVGKEYGRYLGEALLTLALYGGGKLIGKGASAVSKATQRLSKGAGKGVNITNDVLGTPRAGSALKLDKNHAFNNIVDNYAGMANKTSINNGTLYQLEGSLNGVKGRFEWIIDSATGKYPGQVSHRYFVPGGTLNGVPIKP